MGTDSAPSVHTESLHYSLIFSSCIDNKAPLCFFTRAFCTRRSDNCKQSVYLFSATFDGFFLHLSIDATISVDVNVAILVCLFQWDLYLVTYVCVLLT
jgi:hypothetical protein